MRYIITCSRYDPFRKALSLRNAMDRLFEQSFVNPFWTGGPQVMTAPLDVCETDNGYEIAISLPGVKPEDIDKIQTGYENDILTVTVPVSEASRPKRISVSGGQPKQVTVEASKS